MLNLLQGAGWEYVSQHADIQDNWLTLHFEHAEIPDTGLALQICLDDIPAITIISLLDSNKIVDQEWEDDEIDIDEITQAARDMYQDMIDMADDDKD
jgi:hypothetical protein